MSIRVHQDSQQNFVGPAATPGGPWQVNQVLRSISGSRNIGLLTIQPLDMAQPNFTESTLPHKHKTNIPFGRNSFSSSNLYWPGASLENTLLDWLPSLSVTNSLRENAYRERTLKSVMSYLLKTEHVGKLTCTMHHAWHTNERTVSTQYTTRRSTTQQRTGSNMITQLIYIASCRTNLNNF